MVWLDRCVINIINETIATFFPYFKIWHAFYTYSISQWDYPHFRNSVATCC